LIVERLGMEGDLAVVIEVTTIVVGPHLIYKNENFGAPVQ
jgi:hypothetical protein